MRVRMLEMAPMKDKRGGFKGRVARVVVVEADAVAQGRVMVARIFRLLACLRARSIVRITRVWVCRALWVR